jgi:hypothetical protein
MATHPNDSVAPTLAEHYGYPYDTNIMRTGACPGITKRECFAAMAMQGILSNDYIYTDSKEVANNAVKMADALIEELNK